MSHVADGILHAYLDGALDALSDAGELPDGATAADVRAHLGACADCRARLETERAVRESAGVLLSDASLPHVEVPEFAAVARPGRSRRTAWLPLGWAASVLLAVGAGWLGSEAWRAERSGGVALERTSRQAPPPNTPRPQADFQAPAPEGVTYEAETGGPVNVQPRSTDLPHDGTTAADAGLAAASTSAGTAEMSRIGARGDAAEPANDAVRAERTVGAQPVEPVVAATLPPPPIREVPRPIGVPLNDTLINVFRSDALNLEQIVVTGAAAPRTPAVSRSFTPAVPPLADAGGVRDSRATDAQKSTVVGKVGEMAAFDSVLARERSGRLHFATAESPHPRDINDQVFFITGASGLAIEVARELGQTTVRVRQTLSGGERVEIVSWRPVAVSLDALVVTGLRAEARSDAPARAEAAAPQAEAADRGPALAVISSTARRLGDGRRELMLHSSAPAPVWLAVRADMSENELRALIRRLTRR